MTARFQVLRYSQWFPKMDSLGFAGPKSFLQTRHHFVVNVITPGTPVCPNWMNSCLHCARAASLPSADSFFPYSSRASFSLVAFLFERMMVITTTNAIKPKTYHMRYPLKWHAAGVKRRRSRPPCSLLGRHRDRKGSHRPERSPLHAAQTIGVRCQTGSPILRDEGKTGIRFKPGHVRPASLRLGLYFLYHRLGDRHVRSSCA
jgi:hypothetical protein